MCALCVQSVNERVWCRSTGKIVTLAVAGAVLAGMVIGLVVARIVRAWHDEDANEARLRFQALYVDSTTDIEDLPEQLPKCDAFRHHTSVLPSISIAACWLQSLQTLCDRAHLLGRQPVSRLLT